VKKTILTASVACLFLVIGMAISLTRPVASLPSAAAPAKGTETAAGQPAPPAVIALLKEESASSTNAVPGTMDFGTINGVRLTDDKEQIVSELGLPLEAAQDELLAEQTRWTYPDMNIAFTGTEVDYVSVPSSNRSVRVGDEELPVTLEGWVGRYGEPQYKAEDGVGYVDANGFAAKLFLNQKTGQVLSVDFFWADME